MRTCFTRAFGLLLVHAMNHPFSVSSLWPAYSRPSQMFRKLGERDTLCSFHVQVVTMLSELLVNGVRLDPAGTKVTGRKLNEGVLEFRG